MKTLKYISGIYFCVLLLNSWGCKKIDDKFLQTTPETFYTVDNIFSTSQQVDQAVVAIYSILRDMWANPTEQNWTFVFRGNGTDMFDVPSIRRGNTFNNYGLINSNNSNFNSVFGAWYQIIAKANLAIYSAELPNISWASASEKAYTVAQARFFRAFAYRNLAELFGGVPIVTDITKEARYDYTRATRAEVYQFAIDELLAIENDLPDVTAQGGRLVKGAAQHNLCELYLALGTQLQANGDAGGASNAFTQSIAYANKVIDGGIYSLMTSRYGARKTESQGNVYWDLFQENSVNYQDGNKECIWAIQIDYTAYRAEDPRSKLPYSRTYGPVLRDGSPANLTGTGADVGGRGIAQVIPTMYTRDSIYGGVFADDMRNSDIVFRRNILGNVATSPYYQQPVPWSVLYDTKDHQSLNYPISCKIATDKYTGIADGENLSNLFRDDYFIRLPETILLRAEAKQRSGDKEGAAADVNLLRARANCSYLVTSADMDDQFSMILDERARELVYEECRWNTLLRMGGTIAADRIRKYAYWPEAAATLTFNYNLWPIPQLVIDANKDVKLDQNPGW
ncbi:MAG: RagB/SusD family nutrient uptake outer membrane protein [Sphingobacteriales bacterium]|nr:RagB/SusD family nutrient uptake outer membrane protein [Sphingobacteriales bacterium]OJY81064.1 MAG: RagB/SusD family nutrient uptake outer membrane protein [Sphingobacteriales bacterium 44-15]